MEGVEEKSAAGVILYLGLPNRSEGGDPVPEAYKLPGVWRYARLRGYRVVALDEKSSSPKAIPSLLRRYRPIGCIAEASRGTRGLVPRLFGSVPLVYLSLAEARLAARAAHLVPDTEAIVRAALGELSATHPAGYAVVEFRAPRRWSARRVALFCAAVREKKAVPAVFARHAETARKRAARLACFLAALPRRTAVFAVNDETAREVLAAAKAAGRRIPSEITVVGVDNLGTGACAESMDSTSVEIDFERAGYRAAALVDALRRGEPPRVEKYGPLLTVRRASTRGCRPIGPALRKALLRIRAEACMGLRAREVAAMIPGSRRLAEMRFRESVGHSILDEIEHERLSAVRLLLRDTTIPLEEIFVRSGYPSFAALRKAFKLRTGLSLTAWRRANADEKGSGAEGARLDFENSKISSLPRGDKFSQK